MIGHADKALEVLKSAAAKADRSATVNHVAVGSSVAITGAASGIGGPPCAGSERGLARHRHRPPRCRHRGRPGRPDERARAIAEAVAARRRQRVRRGPGDTCWPASSPAPGWPARPTGGIAPRPRSTTSGRSRSSRDCVRCSAPAAPPSPSAPTRPPCNRPSPADWSKPAWPATRQATGGWPRRTAPSPTYPATKLAVAHWVRQPGHRARLGRGGAPAQRRRPGHDRDADDRRRPGRPRGGADAGHAAHPRRPARPARGDRRAHRVPARARRRRSSAARSCSATAAATPSCAPGTGPPPGTSPSRDFVQQDLRPRP